MKGQLTIFFSYMHHTEIVQAMMNKAKRENGKRIVTASLSIQDPHFQVVEDIDMLLSMKPDIVLWDDLASVNPTFSRHLHRYQDVVELLNHGISVYTTLCVNEIDSVFDEVKNIIDIQNKQTVPDSIFDNAYEVIFVDHETHNDTKRNTLRELALKRVAVRLSYRSNPINLFNEEHVLACLSSSPSNSRIIRTAARMASAFNGQLTAIFIQTPEFQYASNEDRQRLSQHQKLASQLGAKVETVFGDDVPFQIAQYARISGVTKIVLGQSATKGRSFFHKTSFAKQLILYAPTIDIHIIPDGNLNHFHNQPKNHNDILKNTITSLSILIIATLCSILFDYLNFTDSNIIMVYLLGVLLTSVMTTERIYSLVSSIASVFIFNFLFTEPRFTLLAYATGYPVTFLVMFLTAYITGTFANRYKQQASVSAKNAYRTQILFDTSQLISKAKTKETIIDATAKQIVKLLGRNIIVFGTNHNQLTTPLFYTNETNQPIVLDEKELETSLWVYKNNHQAGATTDTLADAHYLYLAIRANETVYGVIGVDAKNSPLDSSENSILLSILGECALALENEKNLREKESAALLAQSEQLRANLLRMISHDLRTPLTTISGNASNLMNNASIFDDDTKQQLYKDIYEDSVWLTNLVENLLFSSRFEEGKMQLNTSSELLHDIIQEAIGRMKNRLNCHRVVYKEDNDFLLVNVDTKLVIQVILNIIDNAIKYTPSGSQIDITAYKQNNLAYISISDNGPGMSEEVKIQVFEKFYTGENKTADNRRSLGLGLYLCKSIVEAHGGTISVSDHYPQGTTFTFTLPLEEVIIHE